MTRRRTTIALLLTVMGLVMAPLSPARSEISGNSASAASALGYPSNPSNPLAARPWGVYTGRADGVYPAYAGASGSRRALLAKVALRPRVIWFGSWMSPSSVGGMVRDYIDQAQHGDPAVVVPLAVFRLWPYGEGAKSRPLTTADRAAYKTWIRKIAAGIGGSRVAIVLEPDLAVSYGGWKPGVRMALAAYAAQVLGRLPNAAIYLDASDSDWLTVAKTTNMLKLAGIRYVRGFALGATHYSGVRPNIDYAHRVAGSLARAGLPGKHAVIDTADNGRPFTWLQYYQKHPNGDFDNAETCRTRTESRCNTLGIPPTWQVGAPAWHLGSRLNTLAERHVDGYLWFGRPWLIRQATPFSMTRTLQIARTTPY